MSITKEVYNQYVTETGTSKISIISAHEKKQLMAEFILSESELCFSLLPLAASLSHASLSNFHVGAIAKGTSGHLYFGANMEFEHTSIGQTIHAEQAAFNNAWMNKESGITDLYVTASPCGHCRQFLNEIITSETLNIWILGKTRTSLKKLLPDDFGPSDLNIQAALMSPIQYNKTDSKIKHAFQQSYSPYTKSHSAVLITMKTGTEYTGAYAENAAFNPSLPPMQSAIIMCLLNREHLSNVIKVTLIQNTNSKIRHEDITQQLCHSITPNADFVFIEKQHG